MEKIKYINPNINIIAVPCSMLASSTKNYPCNKYCKLWHICRDRELGKICEDYMGV